MVEWTKSKYPPEAPDKVSEQHTLIVPVLSKISCAVVFRIVQHRPMSFHSEIRCYQRLPVTCGSRSGNLRSWVDLYKVDLKSFDERHYHQFGGRLQPILETIRRLYEMGLWLEIVPLIIPGFNDSDLVLTGLESSWSAYRQIFRGT